MLNGRHDKHQFPDTDETSGRNEPSLHGRMLQETWENPCGGGKQVLCMPRGSMTVKSHLSRLMGFAWQISCASCAAQMAWSTRGKIQGGETAKASGWRVVREEANLEPRRASLLGVQRGGLRTTVQDTTRNEYQTRFAVENERAFSLRVY